MKKISGVAAVALTATLFAPAAPAHALAPYGELDHSHALLPAAGCTYVRIGAINPTSADLPATGGTVSLSSTATGVLRSGGVGVSNVNTRVSTTAGFTTSAGTLSTFSYTASVAAAMSHGATAKGCSSSYGRFLEARPSSKATVVNRVNHAGWLTLTATAAAPPTGSGSGGYDLDLFAPGVSEQDATASGRIRVPAGATNTNRVFVPAGWTIRIRGNTEVSTYLDFPDRPALRSSSFKVNVRGTFAIAGRASSATSGTKSARAMVRFPAAVSCTGSARVATTRVAAKRAKAVKFSVNGKTVRTVKRVRKAATYQLPTPRRGAVTLKARITPKKGKALTVRRTYTACS